MQYSREKQYNAMDKALKDFYESHPEIAEKYRYRAIVELLAPLAAGTIVGRAVGRTDIPVFLGGVSGVSSFLTGTASRRRQVLHEQGIDSGILGLSATPINDKGRRYFD